MSSPSASLPFLQELYAQDTLYLVPEDLPQVHTPAPAVVLPAAAAAVETNQPQPSVPVEEVVAQPTPELIPAPVESRPAAIQWLGEAVKGTFLLFDVPQETFQQLPQHQFLQKVLAAVGLTTQQVCFGKLSTQVVHDVKQIAAQQQAQHIILFGQGLPVANLDKMEFYRMYCSGASRFVLLDSLADIENQVELKKKLWDVLQKIFLQS